jgi:hypothetical protein
MHSPSLHTLLAAIGRRLRLQRLATALRIAAWATAAILLTSALLHWFVAPVAVTAVLVATAVPWLLAVGWTASRRITQAECAAWADRHLGGMSAYATCLEVTANPSPRHAAPAVERLMHWVDAAVPRSQTMLLALPVRLRLSRPLLATLVCAALLGTLMQVPARYTAAQRSAADGSPLPQAARNAHATTTSADAAAEAAKEESVAQDGQGRKPEPSATAALAAVAGDEGNGGDQATSAASIAAGAASGRPASGGLEAGDSPDTLDDAGFSTSWQGELARQVQATAATSGSVPERADNARTAEYLPALAPAAASTADASFSPAPAVSPEERARVHAGPAEQAYIRAYFSGSGATQ